MRIHILGGAGSGKSHIAAMLGEKLHLPHYDLDDIFWNNEAAEYGVKAPEEQRERRLREIVSQEAWIVEGVYIGWLAPSFSRAERIFALAPPLAVQEERIWKRYEERRIGAVPNKKRETLDSVSALIAWNETYNLRALPRFIQQCEYGDKLTVVEENAMILEMLGLRS